MKKKQIFLTFFCLLYLTSFSSTIKIATFNIKHLGSEKKNLTYVCEILTHFDFTAIQEIQSTAIKTTLQPQLERANFKLYISPYAVGESKYKEYYGFAYRNTMTLKPIGFYPNTHEFTRPPFAVILSTHKHTFLIINTHIKFGSSELDRSKEIVYLPQVIHYFQLKSPNTPIILLGDFNTTDFALFDLLLLQHTDLFTPFKANIKTTIGTQNFANQYDHIFLSPTIKPYLDNWGTIEIRNLSLPDYKKNISDHRPVFIKLQD